MGAINFDEFFDSTSLEKIAELYEVITKERLSVKDTGINYRVINHWDEKGLIRFARNSTEGHRRFSFVDFIWIKVVNELREFGVKLQDIEKIANGLYHPIPMKELMDAFAENIGLVTDNSEIEGKQDLIEFIKSGDYKNIDFSVLGFNFLHALIAEAIATRKPISILLFKDGEWFPFIKEREHLYPDELRYKIDYIPHIMVSITDIIFRYIIEDELQDYFGEIRAFTPNEIQLLRYVKDGKYKKIVVNLRSKEFPVLVVNKGIGAKEEIIKVLRQQHYKDFLVTEESGNEVRISKAKVDTVNAK